MNVVLFIVLGTFLIWFADIVISASKAKNAKNSKTEKNRQRGRVDRLVINERSGDFWEYWT